MASQLDFNPLNYMQDLSPDQSEKLYTLAVDLVTSGGHPDMPQIPPTPLLALKVATVFIAAAEGVLGRDEWVKQLQAIAETAFVEGYKYRMGLELTERFGSTLQA